MIPVGYTDAEGVFHLGEDTNPDDTWSGLFFLVTKPISDIVTLIRASVTALTARFGTVTAFTPDLANFTETGATISGRYKVVDGWCDLELDITMGAGSAMGTGPTIPLPVAMHASYLASAPIGGGLAIVAGGNYGLRILRGANASTAAIFIVNTGGTYESTTTPTATVPATWGTTGVLQIRLRYRVA